MKFLIKLFHYIQESSAKAVCENRICQKTEAYKQKYQFYRKSSFIKLFIVFIYSLTISPNNYLFAHHLRAGEISAKLISCQSNTYMFTITGYTDTRVELEFGYETLDLGDGTLINLDTCTSLKKDLGDNITVKTVQIEHSFPGPGVYTIRYQEPNRNDNVLNMDNSGFTAFYVETQVVIDPFLYCNNTPILLNPPIDRGVIGIPYLHNPAAWDPDGDSLVYKLVACKQDIDMQVSGFMWPNVYDIMHANGTNSDNTGPATFTMDPVTGDIVWDAPAIEGQYNIAFIVEEWRKVYGEWFKLGYLTRDMQILIETSENNPPILTVPPDTCVEAGTLLDATIGATDPEGHAILIEAFSGVFNQFGNAVTFSPSPFAYLPSPAALHLTWQTNCNQVRKKPYQLIFKATDQPIKLSEQPPLINMGNWYVKIVAPAPEGLTTTPLTNNSVKLNWQLYHCSNAEIIQIWRRIDSLDIPEAPCVTGIPKGSGYELIGQVSSGDTVFIDDNNLEGLSWGAKYCYRLTAIFPQPRGGESYPSEEACIIIKENPEDKHFGPVITNVDILSTDPTNGKILIRWTSPFYIDTSAYKPPFTYELQRAEGFSGSQNLVSITEKSYIDTIFVDTLLNTKNKIYNYCINVFETDGSFIDQSSTASSVRLEQIPSETGIKLHWKAVVPWSNEVQEYPYHYIYRDHINPGHPEQLLKLDSTNVIRDGNVYHDTSLIGKPLEGSAVYQYYVTTSGSYGNSDIKSPLLNRSQVTGMNMEVSVSNCTPASVYFVNVTSPEDCREYVQDKPCNFRNFQNEIHWQAVQNGNCENAIAGFNIYYSETGKEGSFKKIANTADTFYIHRNLPQIAGCYKVSAVSGTGRETTLSEKICHDNCPYYELPNVFTPNDDGKNDLFKAFNKPPTKCPRFVKSVIFKVFNRYGIEIYNSELNQEASSIYIDWDGRDSKGIPMPVGNYYYIVKVQFYTLDPSVSFQTYKGWVKLTK